MPRQFRIEFENGERKRKQRENKKIRTNILCRSVVNKFSIHIEIDILVTYNLNILCPFSFHTAYLYKTLYKYK